MRDVAVIPHLATDQANATLCPPDGSGSKLEEWAHVVASKSGIQHGEPGLGYGSADWQALQAEVTMLLPACKQTLLDCYQSIGGVSWLPATTFLPRGATTSALYLSEGLCRPSSPLFEPVYCAQCQLWETKANFWLLFIFLVFEHLMILFKIAMAILVPAKPGWVVEANARCTFDRERMDFANPISLADQDPPLAVPKDMNRPKELLRNIQVPDSDDQMFNDEQLEGRQANRSVPRFSEHVLSGAL
mmetsp:Transcript_64750/g.127993  ORF Transcript_64750/g.127993 Transcript_64750/m.127993 type:complete len:246 (+) Transcript_64750:851-1588(+)